MGKVLKNLTKEQILILDEIKNAPYLKEYFYFTGGTALSSAYLHHRYSDDLDIFSQQELDNETIFDLVSSWGQKHGFRFESRFREVVYSFDLTFSNNTQLKVDFSHYPHKQIEPEQIIKGLRVDSLTDIAVNKMLTIYQRNNVKDFVDLYFLLKEFSLWDLVEGVKVKFRMETEPLLLAADFLKINDFTQLPRMIKPLSLEELKEFFDKKAKELGKRSVT